MGAITSCFSAGRYRISDHRFRAVANACGKGHVAALSRNVKASGVSVILGRLSTLTGVSFTSHAVGPVFQRLAVMHINASKKLRPFIPIKACITTKGSVKFSKILCFCTNSRGIHSGTFRSRLVERLG